MRNLGLEGKGWLYRPVSCGFLSPYKFAVVAENHVGVGVAHFESQTRRVLEVRQVITRVAVTQSVERPTSKFRCFPRFQQTSTKIQRRDCFPRSLRNVEPSVQVWFDLNETTARARKRSTGFSV